MYVPLRKPGSFFSLLTVPQYSMYGHIKQLAEAEKRGVEAAGGTADVYQYVCIIICQLTPQLTAPGCPRPFLGKCSS